MTRAAALLMLVLLGGGCSCIAASISRPRDIASIRAGLTRGEVEDCLGRARRSEVCEGGVRVTYRLRVLDPSAPAPCKASTNAALVGSASIVAGTTSARVFRDCKPLDEAARLAAGAVTFVATDFFLTLKTVVRAAQHPRREVVVEYDADGRVRSHSVRD